MSTTTATPTKVKVAEPDVFDGSPYKFRDWLRQLTIFIRAREIKDDEKKILIALSYMKSGTATAWANRWFDKNGTKASLGSWADFQTELEAAFQDKDAKRKARERLETYKQRDARIDDFISRFDSLTADAGIDSSDDEQIRLLELNVKSEIINAVYGSGSVPATFPDYRKQVLSIGRLLERRQEQIRHRGLLTIPTSTHTNKPTPPAPPMDKRTPTGVIYGGRGKPMEVDAMRRENRCFGCGALGHFRRECPTHNDKKINVRAAALDFTEEEKAELMALWAEPKKEEGEEAKEDDASKDFV